MHSAYISASPHTQAYISASQRTWSVIVRAKTEVWQTTCFFLLPKPNPKSVYFLLISFVLSLALLPHLLPLLAFSIVPLLGVGFSLCRLPEIPLFCLQVRRPCVAKLEATFPSSAEPRALRSLTRPFAPPSFPMSFLRLPLISPRPLALAHTKLPIPC